MAPFSWACASSVGLKKGAKRGCGSKIPGTPKHQRTRFKTCEKNQTPLLVKAKINPSTCVFVGVFFFIQSHLILPWAGRWVGCPVRSSCSRPMDICSCLIFKSEPRWFFSQSGTWNLKMLLIRSCRATIRRLLWWKGPIYLARLLGAQMLSSAKKKTNETSQLWSRERVSLCHGGFFCGEWKVSEAEGMRPGRLLRCFLCVWDCWLETPTSGILKLPS